MEVGKYNPYRKGFEDDVIPAQGQKWGGMVKYDALSRWAIADNELDDCLNWLPMGGSMRQIPANGTTIATLVSTVTWMIALPLNATTYIFALCANGHIYQVSLGGAVTDLVPAGGFSQQCDITSWQGNTIIFSDFVAAKIYSWNGTTFSTVFTAQPANFIQVYSGRLWMANGNVVTFTAGGTFNSLGGDSGNFTIGDADTPPSVVAMVPFLGQLYIFGSDWIQTVNSLFDSGTPAQLQFQRYTLEGQVGPVNKWSIILYGAYLYFANQSGFWQLVYTQPVQISQNIDGFFQNISTSSSFSSAFTYIYGMPCLLWNANWTGDSVAGEVFIYTNEQQWCRSTGAGAITFITDTVVVATGLQTAFGTNGTALFQLYGSATTSVTSTASSKLWNFGHPLMTKRGEYLAGTFIFTGNVTVTISAQNEQGTTISSLTTTAGGTITWRNNSSQVVTWQNNTPAAVTWSGLSIEFSIVQFAIPFMFKALGVIVTVTGAGSALINIIHQIKPTPAVWGA